MKKCRAPRRSWGSNGRRSSALRNRKFYQLKSFLHRGWFPYLVDVATTCIYRHRRLGRVDFLNTDSHNRDDRRSRQRRFSIKIRRNMSSFKTENYRHAPVTVLDFQILEQDLRQIVGVELITARGSSFPTSRYSSVCFLACRLCHFSFSNTA